jgi:hypothetical protein
MEAASLSGFFDVLFHTFTTYSFADWEEIHPSKFEVAK